tara:strand:+ start:2383 stop:2919 length:537 start_codon:yes stop_codon:yes gene_type:complete
MAKENKPEFTPQEKKLKLDVHKVSIKTGFSDVDEKYYVEIKSLNNPLFKGRQLMEDPDDADLIFRNMKSKEDVYNYIGGIYKEPSAMSLSTIFADEKEIRDQETAKEMAAQMSADEPGEVPSADAPSPVADEEPAVDDPTPDENKDNSGIPLAAPGLFARSVKFDTIFSETIDRITYK